VAARVLAEFSSQLGAHFDVGRRDIRSSMLEESSISKKGKPRIPSSFEIFARE
jgi:hypothetical protein